MPPSENSAIVRIQRVLSGSLGNAVVELSPYRGSNPYREVLVQLRSSLSMIAHTNRGPLSCSVEVAKWERGKYTVPQRPGATEAWTVRADLNVFPPENAHIKPPLKRGGVVCTEIR